MNRLMHVKLSSELAGTAMQLLPEGVGVFPDVSGGRSGDLWMKEMKDGQEICGWCPTNGNGNGLRVI